MRFKLLYIVSLIFVSFSVFAQELKEESKKEEAKNTVTEVEVDTSVNIESIIKELKEREKKLNEREIDLNAREERLNTLEKEILARENDLKKLRKEVTDRITELRAEEDKELDNLARMYSSAKPKSAAAIIVKMDLEKAVSIFRRLSPQSAGKLLNEMGKIDPLYASKLSEQLTPQGIGEK